MNKKGFTLVELLAVIIVLSIIVLITAISTSNIIKNSKNNLSEVQIKSIEKAAKTYYVEEVSNQDNVCVNVSELISKGYIDQESIRSPKDNEEMLGSVKIRYIDNKYTYEYKNHECIKCIVDKQNENKYTVGDIVTCEFEESTDKFYIIKDAEFTEENIEMLTEKNIHITTFRQSDDAGTIYFCSSECVVDMLSGEYVYGNYEKNLIFPIVENYVFFLNNSLMNVTGKLMSMDQAKSLGCDDSSGICPNLNWLLGTYFWLGNKSSYDQISLMSSKDSFGSCGFAWTEKYYVRPVITLPTSNLK